MYTFDMNNNPFKMIPFTNKQSRHFNKVTLFCRCNNVVHGKVNLSIACIFSFVYVTPAITRIPKLY